MLSSGVRPEQSFYDSVRKQETEKTNMYRLNQVAIRMVEMPPLLSDVPMDGPEAAVKVMADMLKDYDREVVAIVNLQTDGKPINMNVVSMGALDQSIAHPREILKSTILSNASAIMLVHNHPSNKLQPSMDDIATTARVKQLCDLIGVKFLDHIIVGPGRDYYSFHQKQQIPLSSLKLTNNLEDIELEGFRVAENTAVKEEKKTVTLTVAECSEFHNMGEFHENITSVAEAVAKFKEIPPERMHGIPAIGIRVADLKNPEDSVEMDVLIGKRIDLDMLRYVPDIAENWQAQQMIAALIHDMPEAQIEGEIPENIQKKIDWIESRDKRADELHQITDKLEKGVKDVFQSDKYKQFLNVMAKFPRYSVNNTMLIMMQRPDAQLCQSFTGWKQMGRYVKKGEKGISILAPAPYKIEREQTKLDEKGRPVFDADGEPVKEKVEVTIRAFKVVKTFDLSQTDGKELPTIGPSELVGNIEGYPKLLQALQEISPVPVSFELIDGDAKGFYHLEDKKIVVQDGMSEVQTIKTLLHEMAHEKLHDKDNVPEAKDISRNGKEVEAESVAYVVCQHYGINTSDYSFSYVAGWTEGKETPELKASLDKIRQTASEFIYQIDQKMEVLMADKDQVQESAKTSSPFAQELMDKITEGAKDLGFIPVVPETQEKTANPELKVVVDKALKDLDKKRTLSKVKESVKSKLKANTEKAEQAPKKSRTTKAKEERA
ncbi:MAG: JAB domain-containing protein [Anaerobutyricum sp.]